MSESARPNLAPWLIAGFVGCSVFCLALSILAVGGYFIFGQTTTVALPPITSPIATPFAIAVSPTPLATATLLPTLAPTITDPITTTPTLAPAITRAPIATNTPARPTGKIAFSVNRGDPPPDKQVWVMNADGTGAKQILDRASSPIFSRDGTKIFYYHWEDGIFVANADGTESKKIVGESNAKFFELSHDGQWLAWTSQPSRNAPVNINAVLPDGTGKRTITFGGSLPSWSPDDKQIIFHSCRATACGLFKINSAGGDAIQFTSDVGSAPAWSPNGQRIVYHIEINGVKQLFTINADGTGKKQLTHTAAPHVGAQWSLDGNSIFYRSPEGGSWAIWRMTADGANPIKLIDNVPPTDEAYEKLTITK